MKYLYKVLPIIFSLCSLGYVIYYQSPPDSWSQASLFNWVEFFLPLSLALFFISNLFFQNLLKSFLTTLGITLIVVLKGQDKLTIFNSFVILVLVGSALYKLKKPKEVALPQRKIKLTKLKRQRQLF